jgi:hypothetical protein
MSGVGGQPVLRPQSMSVCGHNAQVNLKKEKSLVVGHKGEIGDVDARVPDRIKLVVYIKEEKPMSGCVGRQNVGCEHNGTK